MRIDRVAVVKVTGPYAGPEFPPGDRQAQQLDIYPEFNARPAPSDWLPGRPLTELYLEIGADDGTTGLWGAIDEMQAAIISRRLRPLLLGHDPLATELLFDLMIRQDRHGRTGLFTMALSAVDCALWDLKGKAWGQPVYRLLGGPTRPIVPAYASMLGYSVEPEAAAATAREFQAMGYAAQKWFFRYGPSDGEAGKAKNLALAAAVREATGPAYTLMFDAFMGWTTHYAIEMARGLESVRPYWLEEPIPPERVGALREIRRAAAVPIATGEHIYTRWQTKELLVNEAVDVLQNDPDWTGGITELVKVCALASAFETPVVAHGHSLLPALHVAGAQSPATVPFVEYLVRYQELKQALHMYRYRPQNGAIPLPDLPGLGLALDGAKIEQREEIAL